MSEQDDLIDINNVILPKLKKNIDNFEIFNQMLLDNNALMAGGSLLSIYNDELINDIDIYVNIRNLTGILKSLILLNYKIRTTQSYIIPPYDNSFFRQNGILSRFVFVLIKDEILGNQLKVIDIIIVKDEVQLHDVVTNFDLTFCEIFYDGKKVNSSHPHDVVTKTGTIRDSYLIKIRQYNYFTINRIFKYLARGYNITNITPDDFDNFYEIMDYDNSVINLTPVQSVMNMYNRDNNYLDVLVDDNSNGFINNDEEYATLKLYGALITKFRKPYDFEVPIPKLEEIVNIIYHDYDDKENMYGISIFNYFNKFTIYNIDNLNKVIENLGINHKNFKLFYMYLISLNTDYMNDSPINNKNIGRIINILNTKMNLKLDINEMDEHSTKSYNLYQESKTGLNKKLGKLHNNNKLYYLKYFGYMVDVFLHTTDELGIQYNDYNNLYDTTNILYIKYLYYKNIINKIKLDIMLKIPNNITPENVENEFPKIILELKSILKEKKDKYIAEQSKNLVPVEVNENNLSLKCFDIIMQTSEVIDEFLSNNDVFILINGLNNISDNDIMCYNKELLKNSLIDKSNWFYECIGKFIPNTRDKSLSSFSPENSPYIKLTIKGDGFNGFFRKKDIEIIFNEQKIKIFYIIPLLDENNLQKTLTHTIDWTNSYGDKSQRNFVSSNHCQYGSNVMLYTFGICKNTQTCVKSLLF